MRIVAGLYRGRIIKTPEGKDTRPTLERVREAIFSIIQYEISDATVLDLFSGSGSLGIEALSRGARYVVFNDYSRPVAALIEENLKTLGITKNYELNSLDYQKMLTQLGQRSIKFDVVLLDPPYREHITKEIVEILIKHNNLATPNVIVIETDRKQATEDIVGYRKKEYNYGNIKLSVYRSL